VEKHVDELLLDASSVLPNLRHGRAQRAYEPTAARSAARISRLARHETATRDAAEPLRLLVLFNGLRVYLSGQEMRCAFSGTI
jgi:hypothetical protein